MNKKITISIIMALIMAVSTIPSIGSADPGCGGSSEDTDYIDVEKRVYNGTAWVDEIDANLSDIVRFNITISYYCNNESTSYMETNISVKDILPNSLEFADNIEIIYGPFEYSGYTYKSDDNKTIWWNLTEPENVWLNQTINLYNTIKRPDKKGFESVSIYFDAKVVNYTEFCGEENEVCVTAWETCTTQHVYGYADATVIVKEPENPDISIEKKVRNPSSGKWMDGPLTVYYEDLIIPYLEFQINISNTGNVDLNDIVVTDILPDFLTYDAAIPPMDEPTSIDGKKLTWGPFSLAKETECSVIILVEVNTSDIHKVRTGENFVNVTAEEDLYDEDVVPITIKPHIIVDKKIWDREKDEWVDEVDYVIKSENVKFKITTTYYGDEIMTCMLVDDWFESTCWGECDGCLEVINGSEKFNYPSEHFEDPKVNAYSPTGIQFKWDCDKMFNLKDGESIEIIFEANVTHYGECDVINHASSKLSCTCPDESYTYEDYDTAIISCTPPPPLFDKKVRKDETDEWADEVNTIVGDTIQFKLELEHYGNTDLSGIIIKDKLPCILEYVQFSTDVEVVNGDAELILIDVNDDKRIDFYFNRSLGDNGTITIIFEAFVNGSTGDCSQCGTCINYANASGEIEGCGENFFAEDSVNITAKKNCPPDPLWIKTDAGASSPPGEIITFTSKVYDPNDDRIQYKFKIEGGCEGPIEQDWSEFKDSNETIVFEYTFDEETTFTISIKAKDEHGLESDWECHRDIIIDEGSEEENHPPFTTGIGGDSEGEVDEVLELTTTIDDPDGDQVKYQFRVDGENDEWSVLMDPDTEVPYEISFDEKGTYEIQVRAEDEHGLRSSWSEVFEVEIGEEDDDSDDDDEEARQFPILDLLFPRFADFLRNILDILKL